MVVKVEGFSEVLEIIKGLFSGLKSAAQIPAANRKEMQDALADTAELVDETLTILKQHLSQILSELQFGDKYKAEKMIYELADFQGWETKYRQFQLCDTLREAVYKLEQKGLYQYLNQASYGNLQTLQQRLWDYIGGETNAAHSVGTMLIELAKLAPRVDSDPDAVKSQLEDARQEINTWRQKFILLEQEIRGAIK
ncbi:hypothetical protein AAE02nite_14140 [Adhaeribacter aerolatus]|uniref:Uncharacterized protein n=1 Tax=Adhaeribacter aerolatus TaxID=670289 RepID=A0A512AVQ1_9BACT|nr:hypothetical protein [Adhaeribacter aerolatus]GEO03750.1 hypothetical protein AAE02nite_14140 [Adhaeribacter aerolatus]